MCLGCAESDTDAVNSVESEEMQTGVIKAGGIEEEPQPTNQLTILYQDAEWETGVVGKVDLMFKTPLDNLISSINNRDYISMQSAGADVASVASYLLEESKKYTVSPQRQTRKNECEAGWWEMEKAGDYFASGAKKIQADDLDEGNLDIETGLNYFKSAGDHLTKAGDSGFPTEKTPTETSSGVIATWSGNSIKDTQTFHVYSNEWKISWNTEPGQYGAMNFQIYVYNSDGTLKGVAANVIGSSSDSSIIRGSGDYYLSINTAQPYEITVESLN